MTQLLASKFPDFCGTHTCAPFAPASPVPTSNGRHWPWIASPHRNSPNGLVPEKQFFGESSQKVFHMLDVFFQTGMFFSKMYVFFQTVRFFRNSIFEYVFPKSLLS